MQKHHFLLPLLFILSSCRQPVSIDAATSKTAPKLSIKDMQGDLFMLWSAIEEMHPAYGIYTPADSLQSAYKKLYSSVTHPLSEDEFISAVYPFLCQLKCGHTQLRHSEQYKASDGPKVPHLPFEVLVRHHRAWITTHQTSLLATSEEIVSINDTAVSAIIEHGYGLYCGDGYNETFKELYLSEYGGFEDVCNKYYHWKPPYSIKLVNTGGELKTVRVDTLATSNVKNSGPEQETLSNNYPDWTIAKNTDYLPLRFYKKAPLASFEAQSFQYADTTIYEKAFTQIRQQGIKTLILDLRHNGGGDIRVAAKLLSYLADSAFHIVKEMKSRVPNPAINHFEKYFDTARTESFVNGFQPCNQEGTYYHVDFKPIFGLPNDAIPLNKTAHFKGRLIVLIDGATFSSGALSAAAIKANCKNVAFIGRETAGGEEGCSGGTIQRLTLPRTHVVVEFPLLRFVSVAKNPVFGRGLIPTYIVDYTPMDIVDKKDPDLTKAMSIIHP